MKPRDSLVYRVGAAAAGLAFAVTVLLGIGSYVELRRDIVGEVNVAITADAAVAEKETAGMLRSLVTTLRGLATNSLVANALLDNLGRDAYLAPFLRGFGRMTGIDGDVVLTDFAGKPIARSGAAEFSAADVSWIREVVSSGKPSARVVEHEGDSRLILAEPVVYINTGQVEGAMVLAVPLKAIASRTSGSRIDGVFHWLTIAGSSVAWGLGNGKSGEVPTEGIVHDVELPEPVAAIGLKIISTADAELVAKPLRRLAIIFALAALAIVAGVTAAAAALARRIVAPIQRLEAEASSFDFRTPGAGLKPDDFGNDEIGKLAAAFGSMEQRLSAAYAELGAANRELEAFAFSVSHDLRAPLRAVDGFARMLREEESSHLSPDGLHMLEQVWINAGKMGKLIDDILQFSRVGRSEMQRRDVDMGTLVAEVVSQLQPEYPHAKISIEALPRVNGDVSMLRQVWANLIGNALKFSAKTVGPIVEIGTVAYQGECAFFVRDNGVGFDMAYAGKLFNVFQRLHSEAEFPGTGAGLAIVKRIIDRHGGRVWTEAKPDMGATFYFALRA